MARTHEPHGDDVSMRRLPDEEFCDLREWRADHGEDYGDAPRLWVHTLQLRRPEQVGSICNHLHDDHLLLVDFAPLSHDQESLNRVVAELERAVADLDGDLAGVGRTWLVVAPRGVRIARQRIRD